MNTNPIKGKVGNLSIVGFLLLLIAAPFAANMIFKWVNRVGAAGGYVNQGGQAPAQSSNLQARRGTPVRRAAGYQYGR